MSAGTVLRLIGVTARHGLGATAVSARSGVDLEVRRGELVAVLPIAPPFSIAPVSWLIPPGEPTRRVGPRSPDAP